MMGQKDKAVKGLTSGIEGLFKKNKVCDFSTESLRAGTQEKRNDIEGDQNWRMVLPLEV